LNIDIERTMDVAVEVLKPAGNRELEQLAESRRALLNRAGRVLKTRHYQPKTIKAYQFWIERFWRFHPGEDVTALREPEVNEFLTYLAVNAGVAASTQNQALCFSSMTWCWEGRSTVWKSW
jgi:integrase-like protein